MEPIIAEKYKAAFDALPAERHSEPLWEQSGFDAAISYGPGPNREMILTFADGSVFDYYDRLTFSRTDWADCDKSTVWDQTGWR